MHEQNLKESAQETSQESLGSTPGEMLLEEESTKRATVKIECEREFHRGQRRMANRAAEAL